MKKLLILISIFFVMFVSCSGKKEAKNIDANREGEITNSMKKIAAKVNKGLVAGGGSVNYKMVSMSEGLEIAKKNPDAIIVDGRREDEYKAGHIPGAVLLTMETISAETAAKVLPDKSKMILVYCRSGRRSKIAAQTLSELGYSNLIEFGGILDYNGKIEK